MNAKLERIVATVSLLAAGRVTAIIVAPAIAILAASATCASAATAAQSAAATCAMCHGSHGEGASEGVPRLAGQDADYMSNARSMFTAGAPGRGVMQAIATTPHHPEVSRPAAPFPKQNTPPPP